MASETRSVGLGILLSLAIVVGVSMTGRMYRDHVLTAQVGAMQTSNVACR